jgi:hypothetical protein
MKSQCSLKSLSNVIKYFRLSYLFSIHVVPILVLWNCVAFVLMKRRLVSFFHLTQSLLCLTAL